MPTPMTSRVCLWCGRELAGRAARWCSTVCRHAAHQAARLWAETMLATGLITYPMLRAWVGAREGARNPCTARRRASRLSRAPGTGRPRLAHPGPAEPGHGGL